MASSANAALCALVAAIFWTGLGFAVARILLPRVLAIGAAPVTGWAIHSALALPILALTGFSAILVVSLVVLAAIGGGLLLLVGRNEDKDMASIPDTRDSGTSVGLSQLAARAAESQSRRLWIIRPPLVVQFSSSSLSSRQSAPRQPA